MVSQWMQLSLTYSVDIGDPRQLLKATYVGVEPLKTSQTQTIRRLLVNVQTNVTVHLALGEQVESVGHRCDDRRGNYAQRPEVPVVGHILRFLVSFGVTHELRM